MTEQPTPEASRDDASGADQPAEPQAETIAYSPPPESHPDWMRPGWLDPGVQPEGTPAAAPTEPVTPAPPVARRGSPDGIGRILGAALLSAVLASGGTVLVLEGTGALNRPAGAGASAQQPGQTSHPVAVDDSSAVVAAAASVSPAVVRITATGTATGPLGGQIPERGVGSGVIYD